MVNLFVKSGRMQFTPNFPPYALPIVKSRGGKVASAGEIAHAFTYSPHVESIVAIDIDQDVVDFWTHMKDVIKNGSIEDFLREYNSFGESLKWSAEKGIFTHKERPVSMGPLGFTPFMDYRCKFNRVKENIGKVAIAKVDLTDFLEESRQRGAKYGTLLLNNVPEYIENWNALFENPPVTDNGLVVLVKRAEDLYTTDGHVFRKDGRITPGVILGAGAGIGKNMKADGWESVDVAEALGPFGYQPVASTFVTDRRLSEDGKLVGLVQRESQDGRAKIIAHELFSIRNSHGYVAFAFTYNNPKK